MTNSSRVKDAPVRVNAKLDASRAGKLDELARATGNSVSDVIRDAIDHYHASLPVGSAKARKALQKLAGIASGPADLSARYKDTLARDLDAKHGDR